MVFCWHLGKCTTQVVSFSYKLIRIVTRLRTGPNRLVRRCPSYIRYKTASTRLSTIVIYDSRYTYEYFNILRGVRVFTCQSFYYLMFLCISQPATNLDLPPARSCVCLCLTWTAQECETVIVFIVALWRTVYISYVCPAGRVIYPLVLSRWSNQHGIDSVMMFSAFSSIHIHYPFQKSWHSVR